MFALFYVIILGVVSLSAVNSVVDFSCSRCTLTVFAFCVIGSLYLRVYVLTLYR